MNNPQANSIINRGLNTALLSAVMLLTGCALSFGPQAQEPEDLAARQTVLETALGQLGRPYRYGGGDGEGFDCSGLVRHVYSEVGIKLPRTAATQRHAGHEIKLGDAVPGDLVFFSIGGGMHVGIYVGEGRVVHAPAPGKEVTVASVKTPYWRERFVAAVRILR